MAVEADVCVSVEVRPGRLTTEGQCLSRDLGSLGRRFFDDLQSCELMIIEAVVLLASSQCAGKSLSDK